MNLKIILVIVFACVIGVSVASLVIINPAIVVSEKLYDANTNVDNSYTLSPVLNKGDLIIFNIQVAGAIDLSIYAINGSHTKVFNVIDLASQSSAPSGYGPGTWSDQWVVPESGLYYFEFYSAGNTLSSIQGTIERQYARHLF